jgi:hypothetical protein
MTGIADHDREPVGQAINSIIARLNEIGAMAIRPETRDEVFAEERALWTIKSNVEFILSYIREKRLHLVAGE